MKESEHVKLQTTSGGSSISVWQVCHGSGVIGTRQRSIASTLSLPIESGETYGPFG